MGLPARLGMGVVSIYNLGQTGVADIVLPPLDDKGVGLTFGQVEKIWDDFPLFCRRWDSVMFYTTDILASLVYNDVRYVLIQGNKVLLTEIPPP